MTFVIFFTIFSTLYLLMQAYMVRKVWKAFPGLGPWRWLIVAWAVLMVAVMWVEGANRRSTWAVCLGPAVFVAYCWLIVVFWFLAGGLLIDLWNLVLRVLVRATHRRWFTHFMISARATVILMGMLSAAGVAWGVVQARMINIVETEIPVSTLPAGRTRLRIVQISDLHLTGHSDRAHIRDVLRTVQWLKPDVIVSTGDLIDAPAAQLADFAKMFKGLSAPLGKYAIFGNHEYYTGQDESIRFHNAADLTVLRQESVQLVPGVTLAGLDDWHLWEQKKRDPDADEQRTLAEAAKGYIVLLKHQPVVGKDSAGKFNLQLSGHTHGGQILPFWLIVRLRYSRMAGLYDVGSGSQVYVSRGTSTWGPPLRVGAPPEITVIDLVAP